VNYARRSQSPKAAQPPSVQATLSTALLGLLLDPDATVITTKWALLPEDSRSALDRALGGRVRHDQLRLRIATFEGRVVVAASYSDPESDATVSVAVEGGVLLAREEP
jgi:hypothetical protein